MPAGAATYYAAKAGHEMFRFHAGRHAAGQHRSNRSSAGRNVFLVNGLISDCGKLVRQGCDRFGWFDLSTLKEPFRIEGKKTMGYELAFDMAAAAGVERLQLPDVIIYPTGGGTGLIGMWKAFDEMQQLGWIGPERPRMVVVQAESCAPIVQAFQASADHAEMFPNAATVAAGLRVPAAIGDFLMLKRSARKPRNGDHRHRRRTARRRPRTGCASGNLCLPGRRRRLEGRQKLLDSGWLKSAERIVLFNTGSGLKYNHLFPVGDLPVLDHTDANCLDAVKSRT